MLLYEVKVVVLKFDGLEETVLRASGLTEDHVKQVLEDYGTNLYRIEIWYTKEE